MNYDDLIKTDAFKRLSAEGDITIGGQVYRAAALDLVVKRASGNGGWKHVKRFETPEAMEAYWEEIKGMADGGVNAGHTTGYAEAEVVHAPTSARIRAEYERCIGEEQDAEVVVPLPHTAEAVSGQYRRAMAGLVECIRFGAMLVELEDSLHRSLSRQTTATGSGQIAGREGGLKEWLAERCPEVDYAWAMKYKRLAEGVREHCGIPAKVPLTLAMPGGEGGISNIQQGMANAQVGICEAPPTAGMPLSLTAAVGRARRGVGEFLEGKTARQLEFAFGFRGEAPRQGRPRGGTSEGRRALTALERSEAAEKTLGALVSSLGALVTSGQAGMIRMEARRSAAAALKDYAAELVAEK